MSDEKTPEERMRDYKKILYDNVKDKLLDIRISDIEDLVKEEIIEKQIPEKDKEVVDFLRGEGKFTGKGKETGSLEIRKIYAVLHTIMDLLFYFSDYFPKNNKEEHKKRIEKYVNLLKLKEKVNGVYIEKLKKFIKKKNPEKVVILMPLFPSISPHAFSILSEFKWLSKLIIDEFSVDKNFEKELDESSNTILEGLKNAFKDKGYSLSDNVTKNKIRRGEWEIIDHKNNDKTYIVKKEDEELNVYPKSLRKNIEIHLFYLNKPFLELLSQIGDENKKYFEDYKKEGNYMVNSVLNLNKLRSESFLKRYLTEYIVKEGEKGKINSEEINKIAYWLGKHVKTFDEKVRFNGKENGKIFGEEEIVIEKEEDIECTKETPAWTCINDSLEKNKDSIEESYYLSDVGTPNMLGLNYLEGLGKMKENKATYKNLLYYIENIKDRIEPPKDNILIINAQTFRGMILYNFYIKKIVSNTNLIFGWDLYVPTISPPIIPIFLYLSTFSKSYEYYNAKMYEEIVYNCDDKKGEYTICYLAHYLEYVFDDMVKTFKLAINGPKCDKCDTKSVIIKEECPMCGTNHWIFKCPLCGERYGRLVGYLWLSTEIYYTLEKIFLDIPYTFMLSKREYAPREPANVDKNKEHKAIVDEFEKAPFGEGIDIINGKLEKDFETHFAEQYKDIQKKLKKIKKGKN